MNDDEQAITTSVFHCARCGENHDAVTFQKFTRPIIDADGTVWQRWGMCPVTNEPILMSGIFKPSHPNQP